MEPNTLENDKPVLDQPLRRVQELSELRENDLVLIVAQCSPESELDAKFWHSEVTTVASSCVEAGLHYKGPIWTVRLRSNPDDAIHADVMNSGELANGVFASGGAYWITQLYLLLSAAEILRREEQYGEEMEANAQAKNKEMLSPIRDEVNFHDMEVGKILEVDHLDGIIDVGEVEELTAGASGTGGVKIRVTAATFNGSCDPQKIGLVYELNWSVDGWYECDDDGQGCNTAKVYFKK